jgi:hypothetical protein
VGRPSTLYAGLRRRRRRRVGDEGVSAAERDEGCSLNGGGVEGAPIVILRVWDKELLDCVAGDEVTGVLKERGRSYEPGARIDTAEEGSLVTVAQVGVRVGDREPKVSSLREVIKGKALDESERPCRCDISGGTAAGGTPVLSVEDSGLGV